MPITKAVRFQRRLRVGLGGPTGAGKTKTALILASHVAEQCGARVGVIDTENFSASVYADEFDFDVNALTTFSPDDYIKAIEEFERSGTDYVLIVDSLSHAWMGKGGALEQVDQKVLKGADSFTAWRTVSPQHNRLVDKLVNYDGHLFITLRSKMDHALERDEKSGKNKVVKLGMAPVMRDGIEYEMDVYFELDQDHNLTVSKTRFSGLDGYVVNKAGTDLAEKLWMGTQGEVAPERPKPAPATVDRYSGFTEDGRVNWPAFNQSLKAKRITAEDITRAVAAGNADGLPRTSDYVRWLDLHPDKTLADMTAAIVAAKQAACEHEATVDERTTLLTCSKCDLVLEDPSPTPAAPDAAPQPALPA